jgi:hypothetical protein
MAAPAWIMTSQGMVNVGNVKSMAVSGAQVTLQFNYGGSQQYPFPTPNGAKAFFQQLQTIIAPDRPSGAAAPVLLAVSPNSATIGSSDWVTVSGTGLDPSAVLSFSFPGSSGYPSQVSNPPWTEFVGPTELKLHLGGAALAVLAGSYDLIYSDNNGQTFTLSSAFTFS